jgi:putative acetyltransferase
LSGSTGYCCISKHIEVDTMNNIRPAVSGDAFRIAEIVVFDYRLNFYPFFENDLYYFGELNVKDTAADYCEGSAELANTYVYDDGVIKGFITTDGTEIKRLFVEPAFQSRGIGAELLRFAVAEKGCDNLWALEYNKRGIAFYKKHGFEPTGEKVIEDDCVPLIRLFRKNGLP